MNDPFDINPKTEWFGIWPDGIDLDEALPLVMDNMMVLSKEQHHHYDIESPRGKIACQQEDECIRIFEHYSGKRLRYQSLRASHIACPIDAVVWEQPPYEQHAIPKILVEQKSRTESLHIFKTKYQWEWMITYSKVEQGVALAKMLKVAYYGLLYLASERLMVVVKILDAAGNFTRKMDILWTPSKENCNGGWVWRWNAFIDLTGAKLFPAPPGMFDYPVRLVA